MSVDLAYQIFGSGPPLVILHGLFGCKENWRSLAKKLAHQFRVYTLDQRNHGQSPHAAESDYRTMANDLLAFLNSQGLDRVNLLGHSMGGKTAIQFAARYPQRLNRLIIEDIAPGAYQPRHRELLTALDSLVRRQPNTLGDADRLLQATIPELAIRQFLLKNLRRQDSGGFAWRFNLPVLQRNYPALIAALDITDPIEIPTLFVRGGRSDYLPPILPPEISGIFTKAKMATIEDAGHWVHAEQPEAFLKAVNAFLVEATDQKKPTPEGSARQP